MEELEKMRDLDNRRRKNIESQKNLVKKKGFVINGLYNQEVYTIWIHLIMKDCNRKLVLALSDPSQENFDELI